MNALEKLEALKAKDFDEVLTHMSYIMVREKEKANAAKVEVAKAVVGELKAALERAKDDMQGWQSYATDYFKDKHGADDDLKAIDEALTLLNKLKEVL